VYSNLIFCHIQAIEEECKNPVTPVEDSDVQTEDPEDISGQSSNEVQSNVYNVTPRDKHVQYTLVYL
jgi:hypothetical protein